MPSEFRQDVLVSPCCVTRGVQFPMRLISVLVNTQCPADASHGAPGVSNTAESAIWGVDYLLQAASMGMSRIHFHHGIGYRYNSFQPSPNLNDGSNITRPHILPLYHAYLVVNEAIGYEKSWVAELGTLDGQLSAYGIWEKTGESTNSQGRDKGKLVRIVLINSAVHTRNDDGSEKARSKLTVRLGGGRVNEESTMKIRRLSTAYSDSYSGM